MRQAKSKPSLISLREIKTEVQETLYSGESMEKENRQNEIRRLERERCQALRDYHKAAEKLDQIDYQLFELKRENKIIKENDEGK